MPFKGVQSNAIITPSDGVIAKKKSEINELDKEFKEKLERNSQVPAPVLGAVEFVDQTPLIEEQRVKISDNDTKLIQQLSQIEANKEVLRQQSELIADNETIIVVQNSKIEPEEVTKQREKDREDAETRYNKGVLKRKTEKEAILTDLDTKISEKNTELDTVKKNVEEKNKELEEKSKEKTNFEESIAKLTPALTVLSEEYSKSLLKYEKLEHTLKTAEDNHNAKLEQRQSELENEYQNKNNVLLEREGEASKKVEWVVNRTKELREVKLKLEEVHGKKLNINI